MEICIRNRPHILIKWNQLLFCTVSGSRSFLSLLEFRNGKKRRRMKITSNRTVRMGPLTQTNVKLSNVPSTSRSNSKYNIKFNFFFASAECPKVYGVDEYDLHRVFISTGYYGTCTRCDSSLGSKYIATTPSAPTEIQLDERTPLLPAYKPARTWRHINIRIFSLGVLFIGGMTVGTYLLYEQGITLQPFSNIAFVALNAEGFCVIIDRKAETNSSYARDDQSRRMGCTFIANRRSTGGFGRSVSTRLSNGRSELLQFDRLFSFAETYAGQYPLHFLSHRGQLLVLFTIWWNHILLFVLRINYSLTHTLPIAFFRCLVYSEWYFWTW